MVSYILILYKVHNMLNTEDYDSLKDSFIESQRLFDKLNHVADQADVLEYDESGMYGDEETMLQRHWLKLSAKIVDGLSQSLDKHRIELVSATALEQRHLELNLINDDINSKISVDYSQTGEISISQIS